MKGIVMNVVQTNEFKVKDITAFTKSMAKYPGITVKEKKGMTALVAYGGKTEVTDDLLHEVSKHLIHGETVNLMDVRYIEGKITSSHYTITANGFKKADNTKDAKHVSKGVLQKMPWAKKVVDDD